MLTIEFRVVNKIWSCVPISSKQVHLWCFFKDPHLPPRESNTCVPLVWRCVVCVCLCLCYVLVLVVSGGWYLSCSNTQSLYTRYGITTKVHLHILISCSILSLEKNAHSFYIWAFMHANLMRNFVLDKKHVKLH